MEGALILGRVLRSPEPFDAAITELTTSGGRPQKGHPA